MDTSDFSFSFKCDWCSFSTKDILEIKEHVDNHKQMARKNDGSGQQTGDEQSSAGQETESSSRKEENAGGGLTQADSLQNAISEENDTTQKVDACKEKTNHEKQDERNSIETNSEDERNSDDDDGGGDDDDDDDDDEEDDDDGEESERDSSDDESSDGSDVGNHEKADSQSGSGSKRGVQVKKGMGTSRIYTEIVDHRPNSQNDTDGNTVNLEEMQKKARRKPPIPKKAIKEADEMTNEDWELDGELKDAGAVDNLSCDEDYDPGRSIGSANTREHPVVTRSRDEQIIIQQFTEGQSIDAETNRDPKVQEQSKAKYRIKQKNECKICHLTFKYKYRLTQHQKTHGIVKRSAVEKGSGGQQAVKKTNIPTDRYKCNECEFSCKFKYRLKEHKAAQHREGKAPTGEKIKKIYACQLCNYVAQYRTKLLRHIRKHTGEKPFACEECGMRFSEKGNLEKHKGRHTTETNFLCEECGKAFRRDINLRMHRRIHKTENLYECDACDYRCVRKDMLDSHRARKHIKMKTQLCDHCGKGFFSKQELESHRRNKHSQRVTPYLCPLCPEAFITEYKLKAHLKTHPEYKPFKCDYCGVQFRKSASLVYHRRIHTGEKPLQCEMCNYVTSTPSNIYKHRKREHGIKGDPNRKILRKNGRFARQNSVPADMNLVLLELPPRVAPEVSQAVTAASTVTPLPPAHGDHSYDQRYHPPHIQLLHTHSHPQQQQPHAHQQQSTPQLQPHPQPTPQPHPHQQEPPPVTTQHQQLQAEVNHEQLQHVGHLPATVQDVMGSYTVPPVHQVHQLLFHQ
ncbi:uncharacterized protein [Ptychodera flava]|uniref:uncharacterized protein n=1 Tax=Ptychodera flava TaxID=63121 RepID=UPI00396A84A5